LASATGGDEPKLLTDEPYNVANVGHVTSNADHREFASRASAASIHWRLNCAKSSRDISPWANVDGGLLATVH
jgi:hypothetical protein